MEASPPTHNLQHAFLLKPSMQILSPAGKNATCSRFSYDGNWLAIGNDGGEIEIHRVSDGGLAFTLKTRDLQRWPCTALCFRPYSTAYSTGNVVVSCDVGGRVHHWHAISGKHLGTIQELENQLYALDIQPHGLKFATAGVDTKVRIYDEVTWKLLHILSDGNGKTSAGHTNRVFAIRWHPTEENIVVSGGWDNTVQIWDLRAGISIKSIFGPNICGDSLDICEANCNILTGSWRATDQLQEWDYGSSRLIWSFTWKADHPCRLYSAKYGRFPLQRVIGAGGSGSNEAFLLDLDSHQVLALLPRMEKAVCSISFSPSGSVLAVTTTSTVFLVDNGKIL